AVSGLVRVPTVDADPTRSQPRPPMLAAEIQFQPNEEPRPAPGLALRPDLSAKLLDEPATDRETQPGAAMLPCGRGPDLPELVEDRLELVGGNSWTFVRDDALR